MVLVTRQAPDFTAAAVLGSGEIVENFNLKKHLNGKPAVLFFWPMDFTFVCPSELIAFDHLADNSAPETGAYTHLCRSPSDPL